MENSKLIHDLSSEILSLISAIELLTEGTLEKETLEEIKRILPDKKEKLLGLLDQVKINLN